MVRRPLPRTWKNEMIKFRHDAMSLARRRESNPGRCYSRNASYFREASSPKPRSLVPVVLQVPPRNFASNPTPFVR